MVAATVRSLAHMRSLRKYEIVETSPDVEAKVEMVTHITITSSLLTHTPPPILHACDLSHTPL